MTPLSNSFLCSFRKETLIKPQQNVTGCRRLKSSGCWSLLNSQQNAKYMLSYSFAADTVRFSSRFFFSLSFKYIDVWIKTWHMLRSTSGATLWPHSYFNLGYRCIYRNSKSSDFLFPWKRRQQRNERGEIPSPPVQWVECSSWPWHACQAAVP